MLRLLPVLLCVAVLVLPIGLSAAALSAADSGLPAPGTLDGLGVNIHFTHAKVGELEQLAAGGFRWVRMDFQWSGIEREKGTYDFSAYDHLLTDLDRLKLRAYFILDYGNRLYDDDLSPHTDAGRAAFCAFVVAAMQHFQGRGIVWEMWNEPNIGFWKPQPNVDDYAKLALAVGKTIRTVAPKEVFVGPTTSEIDLRYIEVCFKAGCLEFWDAVSVHPYRHKTPESAADEYRTLRQLIARYAPAGKKLPILSGEWGYSSGGWGDGYDEALQGRYLSRQWLTNLANDVPISIWYDWHEDGEDPKEGEHHFGSVRYPYRPGQAEVYEPKPAFLAAKALTTQLAGFRFSKRLMVADPDDQVLLFAKGDEVRMVAWTLTKTAHAAVLPASAGSFRAVGHLGDARPALVADAKGLTVTLDGTPLYLAPEQPNDFLRVAAAWSRLALEYPVHAPAMPKVDLTFTNPLSRTIEVDGTRNQSGSTAPIAPGKSMLVGLTIPVFGRQTMPLSITWTFGGLGTLRQDSEVIFDNPLIGALLPITRHGDLTGDLSAASNDLPVRILNPSGEAFTGNVALTDVEGLQTTGGEMPLVIPAGSTEATVRFMLHAMPTDSYRAGVMVSMTSGMRALTLESRRCRAFDDFAEHGASSLHTAYKMYPDGDRKVDSEQSYGLGVADPAAPVGGALAITYRFEKGWKFLCFAPFEPKPLTGSPRALGLWVKGDGSGNFLRLRVVDSTGQVFQPDGGRLFDSTWGYVEFRLDGSSGGHWGGANDGVPHPPFKLDTLLLIDQADQGRPSAGVVSIAAPTLIE